MDSEYKVGALADLISQGDGGEGGKSLSMASLFTTEKRQKEAAMPVVSKAKKTSKKSKRMKKLKEAGEAEQENDDDEEEEGKAAKSKTPSTHDLMKREDEKDEKQRKRDPEQEERTVFVGNLPVSATKKQVMGDNFHFSFNHGLNERKIKLLSDDEDVQPIRHRGDGEVQGRRAAGHEHDQEDGRHQAGDPREQAQHLGVRQVQGAVGR